MEPHLHKNQLIFINRMAYGFLLPIINKYLFSWSFPKPGDVLVVRDPRENKELVKRCVAVEGDPWEISGGYLKTRGCSFPIKHYSYLLQEQIKIVPQNNVIVVGDNYDDSIDSRTFGFIEYNDILGCVIGAFHEPCVP